MTKALEREIAAARKDGVSNSENLPFLLEPDQSPNLGILLVHGFTASPREMRPLGERLTQQGHTVFAVRLPGHGTSAEDLAGRRYEEWLAAVEHGYQLLEDRGLSVVGVGLSTGALLLLRLAGARRFRALVLISPYLRLRHRLAPLAGLLHRLIPYHERPLLPEEQPYYYTRRPLQGVHQINRLRHKIRAELPRITAPTLVLTAKGDQTIAPGTAHDLFQRIGSRNKAFHDFGATASHVLIAPESPCRNEAFARIEQFIASLSTQAC